MFVTSLTSLTSSTSSVSTEVSKETTSSTSCFFSSTHHRSLAPFSAPRPLLHATASGESDAFPFDAAAREEGFEPHWEARRLLKLTHELPAFRTHPLSGDTIFHNHLATLHSRSWADEFLFASAHQYSLLNALYALYFYALDALSHLLLGAEGLAQHVTHKGGEPILSSHVWHARKLIWRHTLTQPWQQGDLILIDNMRVAHARMPFTTSGKRKLWVAWSSD